MIRSVLRGALLVVVILLGGCATSTEQCDPNKESFLGAANCMMSRQHGYKAREQDLESELAEQQEINSGFKDLATRIEQEKQILHGQLHGKQSDYAALNRSWQSLQGKLQQRGVENKVLAVQVERMDEKVSAINSSDNMSNGEKEKLLNDLRRQAEILNQELEAGLY